MNGVGFPRIVVAKSALLLVKLPVERSSQPPPMTTHFILVIVFALLAFLQPSVRAAQTQPNVILLLTDDQGYGDLERHGHPLLKTPHMNRLYDESVRFENFYVSPSCSPTRAALLTGMHEFRNGVTHTVTPREHLYKDAVTLPQLFKDAGYRTAVVGKWHLGGTDKGYAPTDRGFEVWANNHPGGAFDGTVVHNGKKVREVEGGYREDIFFDEAMRFIDERGDKPFFCHLATISPHTPLAAPEEFIAPFRGKVSEKHATFLGMVANLDYNVGRLLKFLEERKLDKNTILVFLNDNGGTEGLDVYNAGMRGCKCTIWEGGSRAMCFWRWPEHWMPHEVKNLAGHIDVLPTLCEVAGVKLPENVRTGIEGFSLLPVLESAQPVVWHEDRMLFHHVARWPSGLAEFHKYAMCAVRQGDYLLLRSRPCGDQRCTKQQGQCTSLVMVERGAKEHTYTQENAQFHWGLSAPDRWSLFHVKKDPLCKDDLALAEPVRVQKMGAAYDQWWDEIFPTMIARGGDLADPTLQK